LLLGQTRRKAGQKSGDWSEEKNNKLITKMDENGDGEIHMAEFVFYFNQSITKDPR